MHLQRNATQRNAYHNYILNNNFKFYIFQFFKAVNFLSAVFGFAKISSFLKSNQNICSFLSGKKEPKNHFFFCQKKKQKNNYSRITKSIRKNFFALCGKFINLFDAFNFEIISQSDYGFCYKNYFFNLNQVFRNSYDFGRDFDFGRNLNYDFEKNCSGGFGKNYFGNCNFGFDFGNEIYSIWHDLKGFLFNRKTKKNKFMSAHSVGEGEQK